jgi:2-dehydro-3-deoxygalactonokinase
MTDGTKSLTNDLLISCDWGSSAFRLKLLNRSDGQTLGAITNENGLISLFNRWKSQSPSENESQSAFYGNYLKESLQSLAERTGIDLHSVPVVISGMASSSIGIKELPYSDLPFFVDGRNMVREWLPESFDYKVLLLSGVQSEQDVMRGEETQLIGLMSLLNMNLSGGEKLFIFPGTHSKHISVLNNSVIDFHTYMSGELFQVMRQHSILATAVADTTADDEMSDAGMRAFNEGVVRSTDHALLNSLFSVRVNYLFQRLTRKENLCYLSGLIIGAELQSIPPDLRDNLVLCGSGRFYHLYKSALTQLGLLSNTLLADPEIMEMSAAAGHIAIIHHNP